MVLTAYIVLSPVTGLSCHRRLANCFAKLDTSVGAPGPHAFAVHASVARLAPLPRPPHPAPNVRDDGQRPSDRGGITRVVNLICPTGKAKYFFERGWTAFSQNSPSGKSPREPTRRRASDIAALQSSLRARSVCLAARCHNSSHRVRCILDAAYRFSDKSPNPCHGQMPDDRRLAILLSQPLRQRLPPALLQFETHKS
jgi:hypothetical protein